MARRMIAAIHPRIVVIRVSLRFYCIKSRGSTINVDITLCALGPQAVQLVKFVITDGYSQAMAQVDYASATFLVNAICTWCGWHLVNQGWKQHCRGLDFCKGKRDATRR